MAVDLRSKIETMRGVLLIISLVLFAGCSNDGCRESIAPKQVALELERLDQKLFAAQSSNDILKLLEDYPKFANFFLQADQYPADSILANQLYQLIQNEAIDTLYQESLAAFSDLEDIMTSLEKAYGRLSAYYPDAQFPVIQTAFTGLYKDLVITNEQVIIGMDFFIGESASYKPQQIPDYILKRYTTAHLPANIMQFVSSQFIQTSKGETMLAEMIDYGKSYYLLSKLLPCTPEHTLMGYTKAEWSDSFENDDIIWANFIENELLFETNHQIKQKFLGERPNVYEIGDKCPGRIGRWVGWQIVEAYANKTGISVIDLMKETDANKVFRVSQYKPSGG